MSREQIEELTNELIHTNGYGTLNAVAEHLYNAGYRKQKEAKWIVSGMFDDFLKCSSCGYQQPWQTAIEYKFCAE